MCVFDNMACHQFGFSNIALGNIKWQHTHGNIKPLMLPIFSWQHQTNNTTLAVYQTGNIKLSLLPTPCC